MKCVYEWFVRFRESKDIFSGKPRNGRPATSVRGKNIEKASFTFFDSQGIIHNEFLTGRTTMNAARYIGVLTCFTKHLRRVRPQYAQQGSLFFVHNNARNHTVNIVKQLVSSKKRGGAN
ncbi:hypothetical protein TNCV_476791 [Trichonephila clavipes]|nr:hypothetical protein TNCV_476791 [Trichonephila clavipes]